MTATLADRTRLRLAALFVALLALCGADADELSDFQAAVAEAAAQYRAAMATLETRGRDETASAVQRFREVWQVVSDRRGSARPPAFADDQQYAAMFMQVDARIVGALIVIDIGSREAARDALAPIAESLALLSTPLPQR